jgi:hypothetical protein
MKKFAKCSDGEVSKCRPVFLGEGFDKFKRLINSNG